MTNKINGWSSETLKNELCNKQHCSDCAIETEALETLQKFDNFVNLTPHAVNIVLDDNTIVSIPSSGIARIETESVKVDCVAGIDVFSTTFGAVSGLVAPNGATVIVSGLVLANLPSGINFTCVCPNELVRDEKGRIIGCKSFRI